MKRNLNYELETHDPENDFILDASTTSTLSCSNCGSPVKTREEKNIDAISKMFAPRDLMGLFEKRPTSPTATVTIKKELVKTVNMNDILPSPKKKAKVTKYRFEDSTDSTSSPKRKRPTRPLPSTPAEYALRVVFTGERQLKWSQRLKVNGAPALVDKVTGRIFSVK